MNDSSFIIYFHIFISLSMFCSAHAKPPEACQLEYKTCISNVLDQHYSLSKNYEINPDECNRKVSEWTDIENSSIKCANRYDNCIGDKDNIWNLHLHANDLTMDLADPRDYGINDLDILSVNMKAASIGKLRSLLVSANGKLLIEEYIDEAYEPRTHQMHSITKSIMSLLIGIAIDKGYISSEEILIKSYFRDHFKQKHDPREVNIAIKHLLTMTTVYNFTDRSYHGHDKKKFLEYIRDDNARDWILGTEMLLSYEHGDQWLYNTQSTDLLSAVLSDATGKTTLEFAEEYLFKPLEIKRYSWLHDSKENYYGGWSLSLRPRALLRIGQVILNKGYYKEKQIVSQSWLNKSLSNHHSLGGEQGWEYGYLWWRIRLHNHQVIFASGWGGQILALVPSLELAVVITTDGNVCSHKEQDDQFSSVVDLLEAIVASVADDT